MANLLESWSQVGATDADAEHLYAFVLERGTPVSAYELTRRLIHWRLQEQLKAQAEAESRRARKYQPKETYKAGDRLYFPALEERAGVVKKIRAGDNPRYGDFEVSVVQMEDDAKTREFAARYAGAHPLNEERQVETLAGMSPEQAFAQYGGSVRANLTQRLGADGEFVCIGDQFFLKELLTKIPEGYLNIAEAAIEHSGDALTTMELVRVLELPPDVTKTGVSFSLAHALALDARFEDVGPDGQTRWYLARALPPEVREQPAMLDMPNDRVVPLAPELETIASDLFHEADLNGLTNAAANQSAHELTMVLAYPHRRLGTLPLIPSVRALLPKFSKPRLKITFVDGTTHEKFHGFVCAAGSYLAGLEKWYGARHLQPGALVTLRRHTSPLTIEVDYVPQRERSLWVRVAKTQNGQLTFAQERRPLAHKCDEEMLIAIGDAAGIDATADRLRATHPTLEFLLMYLFPELAKLSGAGRVHAKTLYSAVNFVRRAALRAVMSTLATSRAFSSAGGGYFMMTDSK